MSGFDYYIVRDKLVPAVSIYNLNVLIAIHSNTVNNILNKNIYFLYLFCKPLILTRITITLQIHKYTRSFSELKRTLIMLVKFASAYPHNNPPETRPIHL